MIDRLPLAVPGSPGAWRRAALPSLLVLLIGLAGFVLGERMPWKHAGDGLIYIGLTVNGPNRIPRGGTDSYYMQRSLVPLAMHATLRLTGRPLTIAEIERAFYLMNVVMLVAIAVLWTLCADRMRLSRPGRWLGLLALFGNAATLRWILYYPVLMDTTALTLGMAMLYAHLAGRPALLLLIALLGAFCWPTLLLCGLLLHLFPYRPAIGNRETWRVPLPAVLGVLVAVALVGAAVALRVDAVAAPGILGVCGLAGIAGYGFAVTVGVARRIDPRWCAWFAGWAGFGRLVTAAAVMIVAQRVIQDYAYPGKPVSDLFVFGHYALNHASTAPLLFLVAHLAFYGPILLLVLRDWPRFLDRLAEGGPGLLALFGLGALLALTAESRQAFNFYPLVVLFAVAAFDRRLPGWGFVVAFGVIGLALSLVWLPFNHPALWPYFWATEGWQTLGLIVGPRMSLLSYALWLPVLAIVAVVLRKALAFDRDGWGLKGRMA